MKAVILAGGYGKRLRPITDKIPKTMIALAKRPIMDWQVLWLRSHGIDSFVVLAGYLHEKIIEHLDSRKGDWGVEVEYSIEKEPLGTAGALKNAQHLLNGEKRFLMLNGDVITNIDVSRLADVDGIATISLIPLRSTYGVVETSDGKVKAFHEKPILKEHWMSVGVYCLSNEIFKMLPDNGSIEQTTFADLAKRDMLNCVKYPDGYFKSVDSLKDMEEASADLASNKVYGKVNFE